MASLDDRTCIDLFTDGIREKYHLSDQNTFLRKALFDYHRKKHIPPITKSNFTDEIGLNDCFFTRVRCEHRRISASTSIHIAATICPTRATCLDFISVCGHIPGINLEEEYVDAITYAYSFNAISGKTRVKLINEQLANSSLGNI